MILLSKRESVVCGGNFVKWGFYRVTSVDVSVTKGA